jgi:dienelactone hydrolase
VFRSTPLVRGAVALGSIVAVAVACQAALAGGGVFGYDATAPLKLVVHSQTTQGGALVRDVSYAAAGRSVSAYLVSPAGADVQVNAGILFLHMYGAGGSRDEFVDEAVALAGRGVVSLLPTGLIPWQVKPTGLKHDRKAVIAQVIELRRGLDLIAQEAPAAAAKLAFVGHDFGAMYGAMLAGVDHRLKAVVLMTPTARLEDWFSYDYGGAQQPAYVRGLADLEPIAYVGRIKPAPVLFQFSSADTFIPTSVARAVYAKASKPKSIAFYSAGHTLSAQAERARDAYLVTHLGLPAAS